MPNQLSCQKYPIHDGSIAFCRSSDIILLTNRYGDVGVKTCQVYSTCFDPNHRYAYNKKGMSRNENI